MAPRTVAEALHQVWVGADFPPPASILRNVNAEDAAMIPQGFKYSLLTLVEHTDFWQRIWLGRLTGSKKPNFRKDWRIPDSSEWPTVRQGFLDRFQEALSIANAEPFVHRLDSDEAACRVLTQIAVHNAYHVGQFVMVKRAVKASKT